MLEILPDDFDWEFYLSYHKDLKDYGLKKEEGARWHYSFYGYDEGRHYKNEITFIVPSINRPTIERTIESLYNQTNPNWKCILIYDDVDGMHFNDSRIKIIKSEKRGVMGERNHGQAGLVRNVGLELCKSPWIGFLDDDDTIDPLYVETLFKKYNAYDFVVWRMIHKNGYIVPPLDFTNEIKFFKVGISFCYKNKFDNFYFENNRDGEDFDFLKRLQSLTDNYIITPEIFYYVHRY